MKGVRLTVLYNLKEGDDEEQFLKWRLDEHNKNNKSIGGVIRTDFARIDKTWGNTPALPYRFITTLDWPNKASFEAGFYDEDVQKSLKENLNKLGDYHFFTSELLINDQV